MNMKLNIFLLNKERLFPEISNSFTKIPSKFKMIDQKCQSPNPPLNILNISL